jgi:ketosteroid isomerase-like protein
MSRENVEVVRSAFDAWDRGDTDAILEVCDEGIVIAQAAELVGVAPLRHGHAGVLEAFAQWPEQWDDFRIEILRTLDSGDHVVVTTAQSGRSKVGGIEVATQFTFLFTLRDRKVTEWRIFMREAEALEAAGLSSL